ncbi:glycyl-tRNA synthetase 1 [Xylariaceae sp. FL0594]|nr:glycyl-tRNA synthetase 1 [Xylariaceae sp. FL0594]
MAPPMTTLKGTPFDRTLFESVTKRRFFFTESFELNRTSAANAQSIDNRGLYDYGPPGCALQANIVDVWRKHFVLEEGMLEVDCSVITPEPVLKTSGHVDRFADWMCRDTVQGEYLRADHLVENVLRARLGAGVKGDGRKLDEETHRQLRRLSLGSLISKHSIRNPNGDNPVSAPMPFNLMFKSSVGPSASVPVYLRPETAQGQFLNFRKLLEYHGGAMPFASASVGKAYRNEIAPRSGLLRVREFLMAEIEHYVDPGPSSSSSSSGKNKTHERFAEVRDVKLPLLDRATQLAGKTEPRTVSVGDAVREGTLENETLGYFLARIMLFLRKIGFAASAEGEESKIRFRQHLDNEMAHYAADCWDAELLSSYGWVECVGCADRSAYDLSVHSACTDVPLVVREALHGDAVKKTTVEEWEATLDKKILGRRFKRDAKIVRDSVAALDQSDLLEARHILEKEGVVSFDTVAPLSDGATSVELDREVLRIEKVARVQTVREYTPNVIEPSFGIGRILYCLLEQTYWHRSGDVARAVLSLPLSVAPTKVLIVPIRAQPQFKPITRRLSSQLRAWGIANNVDASGASIGKRYARNDELGTPLGITVDFDTVADEGDGCSVTLRERDSMAQVRGSEEEVLRAVRSLVDGEETWEDVARRLRPFKAGGEE